MMDYKKGDGNLPVYLVRGESIPEAWENSLIELYENGLWYKRGGRKDQGGLQVDATMIIEIKDPLSDLFMHKGMTCGWEDLFEYQMELMGAKDSWVNPDGDTEGMWPYSYHQRLASYPGSGKPIDQIESTIEKMVRKPNSRQHNMITWVPKIDSDSQDPPCLQRVWFSLIPNEIDGDSSTLNMDYEFRSRNVMIAAPMNMIGLSFLQSYVRDEFVKRTGKNIQIGRMVDFNDGYHVSVRDQHILSHVMGGVIKKSIEKGESINDRSYTRKDVLSAMDDRVWQDMEKKIINQTSKYLEGKEFEEESEKIMKISKLVRKVNESLVK